MITLKALMMVFECDGNVWIRYAGMETALTVNRLARLSEKVVRRIVMDDGEGVVVELEDAASVSPYGGI